MDSATTNAVRLHYDVFYNLADAVVKTRIVQALERATSSYPVHRVFRCTAVGMLEKLFDDLALKSGLAAQRLDIGHLLLDGPGVFVRGEGARKGPYCACTFAVWAESVECAHELQSNLERVLGERLVKEDMFVIDWHFSGRRGELSNASFEEIAGDVLHDEAYPALGEPIQAFVKRFLDSNETVLVLQGPPGSGKTRLVRAILAAMTKRKGAVAEVMYTADKTALERDEIFVKFITGEHDVFVMEDADHLLMARTNGNRDIHRFLAVADGVVRAQGRKIIFTTNLPNVSDIDEALLRPGRCFSTVRTTALDPDQGARLIAKICGNDDSRRAAALAAAYPKGARSCSVAGIYRVCA